MKKKKMCDNECYQAKAVDSVVTNLLRTDDRACDGDMINDIDCGSFKRINTPNAGIEVDVDEL